MSPPAALDNANGSPAAPLTVEGIPALRANSAPIPKGVAPATSSDMFKSPACYTKPKAKRWDRKSLDNDPLLLSRCFSRSQNRD